MTKKLEYVGTHRAGIFLPGDVFVSHGGTAEVDDALARDLLSREEDGKKQWRLARSSSRKPKPPRKASRSSSPPASPAAAVAAEVEET